MNLTRAQIEPKLISEQDCWIQLVDDVAVRIDYLTEAEDSELKRLERKWMFQLNGMHDMHPDDYYLNHVIKQVRGLTLDGKDFELRPNPHFPAAVDPVMNIANALRAMSVHEKALIEIRARLTMSEMDKKKHSSQPDSGLKGESSEREASVQASTKS